jgi:hypothetical protein
VNPIHVLCVQTGIACSVATKLANVRDVQYLLDRSEALNARRFGWIVGNAVRCNEVKSKLLLLTSSLCLLFKNLRETVVELGRIAVLDERWVGDAHS